MMDRKFKFFAMFGFAAFTLTVIFANSTSAAVILFEDDFSTNDLATNYDTNDVTYNATPETVTIVRGFGGLGSNFLQVKDTFELQTGNTTELTVAFDWAFGTSMFGSGFLVQYSDDAGSNWQTILTQDYTGTNANDSGLAANPASVTITDAVYNFTDLSQIRITNNSSNGNKGYNIDNLVISVDVIPEPASLVLLGIGSLLIAGRRRH